MRTRPCVLVIALLAFCLALAAQQPPPDFAAPAPLAADPVVPAQYRIGPGDVLAIVAYDMPELSRSVSVNAQGWLQPGYLRHPLAVNGRTPDQVAHLLSAALRQEQIAVDPQIEVQVRQIRSHPITVSGEVRYPRVLQAEKPLTLLDALMRAGGLTDLAGNDAILTRRNARGQLENVRLPLAKVLAGTDARYNVLLASGDYIRVPPAGQVFVAGAVQEPGAFTLKPGERLTAAGAIALVRGWKLDGKPESAVLVRATSEGGTREIALNLRRIMDRKAPDPPLEANDILYVPGNGGKSASLFALKSLATSAAVGLGYFIAK